MTINVEKDSLKRFGAVLVVLAVLFNVYAGVSYLRYRATLDPFLGVVQFDINSRAPEIQARWQEAQKRQQAAAASQQPESTTPATLPTKK